MVKGFRMLFKKEVLFTLWLVFCVIRPYPVAFFGDLLAGRLIDTIAIIIIGLFWLIVAVSRRWKIKTSAIYLFFVVLFTTQLISFAWGKYVYNIDVGPRDFYELYRYPYLFFIFSLAHNMDFDDPKVLKKYLVYPFIILGLLEMGFIAFQISNHEFKVLSTLLYGGNPEITRPIGTFYNPNFLGHFLGIYFIFLLSILLLTDKKTKAFVITIALMITLYFIFVTSSRAALVATVFASFFVVLIFYFKVRAISLLKRTSKLLRLVLVACIVAILLFLSNIYLSSRFAELSELIQTGDISAVPNLQARFDMWKMSLHYFQTSPLLGLGPAKYFTPTTCYDNNYVNFLVRYGIIGLAILLSFLIYLFFRPLGMLRKAKSSLVIAFLLGFLGILFSLMIGMFAADLFSSQQLMGIVMAFAGAALGISSRKAWQKFADISNGNNLAT
jgi:O-antigen ligase